MNGGGGNAKQDGEGGNAKNNMFNLYNLLLCYSVIFFIHFKLFILKF